MANVFPTALNEYLGGSSSVTLNEAEHTQEHNSLEAKIGINNSADTTSLDYKVANRLPLSGGRIDGALTIQPVADQVNNLVVMQSNGINQLFEVDTLNGWVKVGPDQANYDLDPNVSLYVSRSQDTYHAINIVNPNTGTNAQCDVIVVNDSIDPLGGYVDLGINGLNFTDPNYATFDAGSGYVYCIDNNFYVGTAGATSKLFFFVGGVDDKAYIKAVIDHLGNMGIGTQSPNANAILDLTSTTKAFMPPRMTTTQRDAISTPTEGMVIYNLTTHVLNFHNGTSWGGV